VREYVGRVYEEFKARPLYVVERFIGHAFTDHPAARSAGSPLAAAGGRRVRTRSHEAEN
jgi:hypothetical protein